MTLGAASGHRPLQSRAFYNHAAAGYFGHGLCMRPHATYRVGSKLGWRDCGGPLSRHGRRPKDFSQERCSESSADKPLSSLALLCLALFCYAWISCFSVSTCGRHSFSRMRPNVHVGLRNLMDQWLGGHDVRGTAWRGSTNGCAGRHLGKTLAMSR